MKKEHQYEVDITWTGNRGEGTKSYQSYQRSHSIKAHNKQEILASSDPEFSGDSSKWNPEEMLLAALSSCHMLWYLHLCADNKVNVYQYKDTPLGVLEIQKDGAGQFSKVILKPYVVIQDEMQKELAKTLHEKAHAYCFIARSVNFLVEVEPTIVSNEAT